MNILKISLPSIAFSAGIIVFGCAAEPGTVSTDHATQSWCPSRLALKRHAALLGDETWCEDASRARQGPFERRFPRGRLAVRGTYVDGQLEGPYEAWHPNGRRRARGQFARGQRVGAWREWHANGNLWIKGAYAAGERVGTWVEHAPSGSRIFEGTYVDGLHGSWRTYRSDGTERSSGRSLHGDLDGPITLRRAEGVSRVEGSYRSNRRHGRWVHYEGSRLVRVEEYRDGLLEGRVVEYGEDGKVTSAVEYRGGQRVVDGEVRQ